MNFFDHTADVGLNIKAQTINDLFITAASALFSEIIPTNTSKVFYQKEISLSDISLENLMVRWLNELLSLFYTEGVLPCDYIAMVIHNVNNYEINGLITYSQADMILVEKEIKAATYHNISVTETEAGFSSSIIFDV